SGSCLLSNLPPPDRSGSPGYSCTLFLPSCIQSTGSAPVFFLRRRSPLPLPGGHCGENQSWHNQDPQKALLLSPASHPPATPFLPPPFAKAPGCPVYYPYTSLLFKPDILIPILTPAGL